MEPILIEQMPGGQRLFAVKYFEQSTFTMPWHKHDFLELTLILEGCGTRIVGDSIESFRPGDTLLLGPGIPHVWKTEPDRCNGTAKAITIHFARDFPTVDLLQLNLMSPVVRLLQQAKRGIQLCDDLGERTKSRIITFSQMNELNQLMTILEILIDISSSPQINIIASEGYTPPQPNETAKWSQINQYVLENFQNSISASKLAEVVDMHPSSVGRYIKRMSGLTLSQYINQIRIAHACRLLTDEDKPVILVCYESGFQNLSHFNRSFLRFKNCTPSEYRKVLKRASE